MPARNWTFAFACAATAVAPTLYVATPAQAEVQYVYDAAGRLKKAVYSNGVAIEYRYDAAGNRTEIVTSSGSPAVPAPLSPPPPPPPPATAPNASPIAVADSYTFSATSIGLPVMANDSDPDRDVIRLISVTDPAGAATTSLQGDMIMLANMPKATVTFTYTIADEKGATATATVTAKRQ